MGKLNEFRGIAARIWCEPANSVKPMDVRMAESIAQALLKVREDTIKEAAEIANKMKWGEHSESDLECFSCDSFCCSSENCDCHTDPKCVAEKIMALLNGLKND